MSHDNPTIAHIVQHLAPGGIETMALDLQRNAVDPNNVHIIALQGKAQTACEAWPRLNDIERLHFLNKPAGWQWQTLLKLRRLLKRLKVEVIHTHHVGPLLYGGVAAKLCGIRHVHTEHDAWHLSNSKRRHFVRTLFHFLRPTIVADAQLVADNIHHHLPWFEPLVILNGVDVEQFQLGDKNDARRLFNLPEHERIVGCAARFTEVKRHDLLLHAFAQLPEETHLALAGDGELRESLEQLSHRFNIEHRVHFLGALDDMAPFYHAIDVFCLASDKEGLPLSPLEAQACGNVAVVTDVGGCKEALDPHSGLLVPANNVAQLGSALYQQLNRCQQTELKESARQFVVEHGNIKRVAAHYHRLYLGEDS